jgi:hypothetical protein
MQKLLIILLTLSCISCKKDVVVKPYSFVEVKFIEDEDYVFIETTEGSWAKDQKLAQVLAIGYKNERFSLNLPNLIDTGNYPNPSIINITYNDGLDFQPFKLKSGFIHISFIDSLSVRGDFNVSLEDDFNGADTRTVVGGFGISIH